jgi:hypothetical protein
VGFALLYPPYEFIWLIYSAHINVFVFPLLFLRHLLGAGGVAKETIAVTQCKLINVQRCWLPTSFCLKTVFVLGCTSIPLELV